MYNQAARKKTSLLVLPKSLKRGSYSTLFNYTPATTTVSLFQHGSNSFWSNKLEMTLLSSAHKAKNPIYFKIRKNIQYFIILPPDNIWSHNINNNSYHNLTSLCSWHGRAVSISHLDKLGCNLPVHLIFGLHSSPWSTIIFIYDKGLGEGAMQQWNEQLYNSDMQAITV